MQHPSMFGAVISQVGVYDMLRYQLFTIGESQHSCLANATMQTHRAFLKGPNKELARIFCILA